MASLSEQLRDLANPEPTSFDPEGDSFDSTRAIIEETSRVDQDVDSFTQRKSVLRRNIEPLLEDQDVKYAGTKVSRASLAEARGDDFDASEGEESEEQSDEDFSDASYSGLEELEEVKSADQQPGLGRINSRQNKVKSYMSKMADESIDKSNKTESDEEDDVNQDDEGEGPSDEEEDDDDVEDDDDDSEYEEEEVGEEEENGLMNEAQDDVPNFSAEKLHDEVEKGKAAKSQLCLWDSLLETRIRFQKALVVANRLPQHGVVDEFKSDKNAKEMYQQGHKCLSGLLEKLLLLQEKLLEENPETKHILYPGTEDQKNSQERDGEEEIPSDTEEEKREEEDEGKNGKEWETNENLKLPCKRKHEMATSRYGDFIAKRHSSFQGYRNSTISKWSEKTRLASGKFNSKTFSSFDKSALTQIQQILADKNRLIKRTQLKRSVFRVLGKPQQDTDNSETTERADSHLEDYDPEIFDDDDFYHQLLRELIERRTSTNTDDPVEMGRQWLELQKLRRKVKRKVDTKGSKGRKIRYNVHAKLVSFMAPVQNDTMADSSRNELFSSLFGQKQSEPACDIPVFR